MEAKVRQAYLYDFYGELLNDHQRRIYEKSCFCDLSLGEIAKEEGISRQGVHDMIRRCIHTLEEYEGKLRLMEKFLHVKEKTGEIQNLVNFDNGMDPEKVKQEIIKISNEILEEL